MAEAFNVEKFKEACGAYLRSVRFRVVGPNALAAVVVVAVLVGLQGTGISEIGGVAIASINAIGLVGFSFVNAIGLVAFSFVNAVGVIGISLSGSAGIIAIGGVGAVGVVAIGGINALGVIAIGYNATGFIAIGHSTSGVFCLSLSGNPTWPSKSAGKYVFSPNRQDSKAVKFFTSWIPQLKSAFSSEQ